MVDIGSVIPAEVTQLVPYGAWLEHKGQKVLVLITDLSWDPVRDPSEFLKVGQILKVKVIRYNYKDRVIRASVKALRPEINPYLNLSRLEPGTVLDGRVSFITSADVVVDLADNVHGSIPKFGLARDLKLGDKVSVVIAGLEIDEGILTLDLVLENDGSNIPSENRLVSV